MPICLQCNNNFPNRILINGKIHNIQKRKYCINCSAFGNHNTSKIHLKSDLKFCSKCGIKKLLNEFYKRRKTNLHSWCKKCLNKDSKVRQKQIKEQAVAYKGGSCFICGLIDDICVYDFHHRDSTKKGYGIATRGLKNFEFHKTELDKCDLLCANCHRKVHNQ